MHKSLLATALACAALPGLAEQPHVQGQALYEHIQQYEKFGVHRFGTPGQHAGLDWMARRLKAAGFAVEEQHFTLGRQYFLDKATLKAAGKTLDVVPQWWLPESAASFALTAPIAAQGDATGRFIRLKIPYDQGAYLGPKQKAAIAEAMKRRPAALLLTIDSPSGEIFTYNVDQAEAPWPVPVILVAPKDEAALTVAEIRGEPISLSVSGRYGQNVPGRNIIGRLNRGKARTIVVSTPESSWFTSSCERGPGIAAFLTTASMAARQLKDVNLVFVATTGHEVGHGGMEYFIKDAAPKPQETSLWVHYGASLACYGQPVMPGQTAAPGTKDNGATRFLAYSENMKPYVEPAFQNVTAHRLVGDKAAVGELRDIVGAGYPNVLGMAGLHPLFHTPIDNSRMTSPALLEPVVKAFLQAVQVVHDKQ